MEVQKKLYLVFFIITFLLVCIYSYISIDLLLNKGDHIDMNISQVFGNILMCSFFISGYIIIVSKEKPSNKLISRLKSFVLFLLFFSVGWICEYNFILFDEGFKTGKDLYWQIGALFLGVMSIGFSFYLLNFKLKSIQLFQ